MEENTKTLITMENRRYEMDNSKLNMTGGKQDMCFVAGTMLDNVRGQLNESGLGSEKRFLVLEILYSIYTVLYRKKEMNL